MEELWVIPLREGLTTARVLLAEERVGAIVRPTEISDARDANRRRNFLGRIPVTSHCLSRSQCARSSSFHCVTSVIYSMGGEG